MAVPAPEPLAFSVYGPIARDDLPGLCERVCGLLQTSGGGVAFCDARSVEPDAVTVEALARLQLGARRHGCEVRLCNASPKLLELVAFMGLENVLPSGCGTVYCRTTPDGGESNVEGHSDDRHPQGLFPARK